MIDSLVFEIFPTVAIWSQVKTNINIQGRQVLSIWNIGNTQSYPSCVFMLMLVKGLKSIFYIFLWINKIIKIYAVPPQPQLNRNYIKLY